MPTYTCWSEAGLVSPAARQSIANALTEIHHEVALAPRYFVQVLFAEVSPGSLFLAGEPAPSGHVWIRADIRAGRTPEQKTELLSRITAEVGRILDISPVHVWTYICDIPGPNIAEYGRPLPHPGGEEAWFQGLPSDLQEHLAQRR